MAVIRPKDETAATSVAVGDIFVIDGATGVRALAASLVPLTNAVNTFTAAQAFGTLTATTVNKVTVTAPATGSTLTIADGKTLRANNTLTFAGTDGTTMTFPGTSAMIARTDAANTFTGTQTVGALVATTINGNTVTAGTGVLTLAAGKTLAASNSLTLAGTDGKTLTVSNSLTLAGTDGTVQTFPSTSGTVVTSASVNAVTNAMRAQMAAYTLKGNATGALANEADIDVTALTLKATPVSGDIILIQDSAASNAFKKATIGSLPGGGGSVSSLNGQTGALTIYQTPQIRITLTQGTPVTTADVASATSLYLEPFNGGQLPIYDGSNWVPLTVAASTYSLPATQTQTGTLNGTTAVTGLTDTSQMPPAGIQVTGTNIPASTTFTPTGTTTGTLSNAATGSGATSLTFKLPPNTNYDVLAVANGGVPKMKWSAAWSNDTTPPTRALQDGVEVTSGTPTQRVIGSVRTSSVAGTLVDSHTYRFVSNRYNEQPRSMYATDPATSWPWSTASNRQANANTANQLDYICCVPRPIWAVVQAQAVNNTGVNNVNVNIGIDTASGGSAQLVRLANLSGTTYVPTDALYSGTPGIGRHFVTWLEFGGGTNTQTWLATAANNISGIMGEVAN
ncbi:hypothetical protein ACRAVF_18920 [Bradyrhizobium oligotrophicum S58]